MTIRLDSGLPAPHSRWSYQLGPATRHLVCDSRTGIAHFKQPGKPRKTWNDPLQALAWMGAQLTAPPTAGAPFKGGWVGYLSYDLARHFEKLPQIAAEDFDWPLFEFTWHDEVHAFDNLVIDSDPRRVGVPAHHLSLQSNFSRASYENAVARALEYIAAGDVFQINLSQRFSSPLPDSPTEIYQRLRAQSPAFFGALLDYGDHALICNSPELFLQVTPTAAGRAILTRPIKGTRPRRAGLEHQLLQSQKDQAELNMIVDLERNDLGRISRIGSVKVAQPRSIETHPTLYHGVASIEGILRDDVTLVDLLRATFPGGSVTGAPKIRAMEIIEELEPSRRGPYCGAIGFLSVDGHIAFNIAIRTMIVENGHIHIPVGGGIVADSIPADEFDETLVKARAMFAALGISD